MMKFKVKLNALVLELFFTIMFHYRKEFFLILYFEFASSFKPPVFIINENI